MEEDASKPPTKPAVVITGAARGIGREFARIAGAEGRCVVLVDRMADPLTQVSAELSASGVANHPVTLDLSNPEAGALLEGALRDRGLHCDVLVNNAGFGLLGPALNAPLDDHLRMVAVHVSALTELTLRFLPGMLARRSGGVINVSSLAAYMAGPNSATYSASKAYVRAFSWALAGELAGTGVAVTCVCPGMVATDFWRGLAVNHAALFNWFPPGSPRSVAEAGCKGFRARKHTVIPGLLNRLSALCLPIYSARYLMWLTGRLYDPLRPQEVASPDSRKPAIVVTGASSGIGREIARIAARDGTDVVLVARSRPELDRLANEIRARGTAAHVVVADLAEQECGQLIERSLNESGLYCDALVNNAGMCLAGPAVELGVSEQLKLLSVNVRAVTELTLRFLPAMASRRRGGVLNVGSIGAYIAAPNMAVYHASKAFVASLSNSLSAELAKFGVRVSCLSPGVVRTPLVDRLRVRRDLLYRLTPKSTPEFTATAAWRGFRAGRRLIIPSRADRVLTFLFRMLPRVAIPSIPVE